jgi:uncharacterized protein YkwD
MKKFKALTLVIIILLSLAPEAFALGSRRPRTPPTPAPVVIPKPVLTNYSAIELSSIALVNDYRIKMGLKILLISDYISKKAEEHDNSMITNNLVSHNGFVDRSNDIIKNLRAIKVGENIAYGFSSAEAAMTGWLNSPGHRENIEGDFNYVGVAVRKNPTTLKLYYTMIFAKI